jgi:hypothetical protein
VKEVVARLQAKDGPALGLMGDLTQTLRAAREAMSDLGENMESLKRSWFFRGYFLERGFYDLDSISVVDYQDGILADKHHGVLRQWFSADAIFERNAEGQEVLGAEGKKRLNGAMAKILVYPRDSPLVVEGYSAEGQLDQQFLTSRQRAATVAEYLTAQFYLNPNWVTFMPMAAHQPPGDQADGTEGIVLTLFHSEKNPVLPRPRTLNR